MDRSPALMRRASLPQNGYLPRTLFSGDQTFEHDDNDSESEDSLCAEELDGNIFGVMNYRVHEQYKHGKPDFLYHLGMVVDVQHTPGIFGDVQYVCVGGAAARCQEFAAYCLEVLKIKIPSGFGIVDLCGGHARYVMYKAGPVLTVSHGMGNPSLSIMVHEVLKLLHYARVKKPVTMIRLGTCGGVGVEPGTTVISELVYNGLFKSFYEQQILGTTVRHPAVLDKGLRQRLISLATLPEMNVPVVAGNTLCADDFYECQARTDGAFCDFSEDERTEFLTKCHEEYGIRNIEMESLAFAAMTHRAGIRAAVVCIALLNRLESDKVGTDVEEFLPEWQHRPQRLVAEFIRRELKSQDSSFDSPAQTGSEISAPSLSGHGLISTGKIPLSNGQTTLPVTVDHRERCEAQDKDPCCTRHPGGSAHEGCCTASILQIPGAVDAVKK